ncbi:hypothetical protein M426DRAFT_265502 [Hypoxylon sp. CI-4A]|nr:hypothetical protein M426DRAFT_265502 [Hypoxylon sp. CI-4A]
MADSGAMQLPRGFGVGIVASTLILCITATIIVLLRVWVRISNRAIGLDDYFMITALSAYIPCCVFVILSSYSGLGVRGSDMVQIDPSGEIYKLGLKWCFFFQPLYNVTLLFIKGSVCVALLRITSAKRYVYPLWGIMILSIIGVGMVMAAVMLQCKPIAANWDLSLGHCDVHAWVVKTPLFGSAVSILTDWLCAILPTFILWKLNMKTRVKVTLAFILALGALASVATCIRMPWVVFSTSVRGIEGDGLYTAGHIVVWSIVECGIGIIASSLPSLRPLFRRFGFKSDSSKAKLTYARRLTEVASNMRNKPSVPSRTRQSIRLSSVDGISHGNSLVTTCEGGGEIQRQWWDDNSQFDDASSQKLIIVKNTQIDIEYDSAVSSLGKSSV